MIVDKLNVIINSYDEQSTKYIISQFIKNNIKLDLNVGDTVELPFYYWCDCDAGKYGVIKGLSEDNTLLNVELSNKIIRIVPIFDIKSINGEEPLFYIKFNKKIYNGAE